MINSSLAEYAFIRVCIFGLQAITPLSLGYTAYYTLRWMKRRSDWPVFPIALTAWCAAETLFYFAVQLPLQYQIQKEAIHPPLLSRAKRSQLFERVIRDVGPADLERHIRWWFRGAALSSIGREGVKDWLAWAFFEGRIDKDGAENELEEYTSYFEHILDTNFAPGYGTAVPIRLTLDKVDSSTRSLAWYSCVGFVDFLVYNRLCWNGFQHYRQPLRRFFGLFPLRPIALTGKQISPVKHLSYWYRPHTAKNSLPVLFIHGIGIGLYPYVDFLRDLLQHVDDGQDSHQDQGQIGILALEIMPVSFRLTHSALSKQEMCNEIKKVLQYHGWDRCVLVGHSYGTIIATHMLHTEDLQPKIAAVLLIDPVCFLLHHPDVAYNFTVRKPTHANEWQLWYFASQDPGVAHTLARRFFWSENVLWLDDLSPLMRKYGMRVTVSLAGRDLIVKTDAVGRYLAAAKPRKDGKWDDDWKEKAWAGKGLEMIWNEDTDHAQVFDSAKKRERLVQVVRTYCELEDHAAGEEHL
ncbi:hypothetical protein AC578_3945 [Pseudocercospora eumusae]|uniref:AB hydrolase-1 domain-containing protein n=1 Tax=Pseudocercospora eumusae TaxID=321146 RepID=A0A139HLV3_9PEZI|nr:hypothetical protein AC578_3945 [Pseudocercospora eumusae]